MRWDWALLWFLLVGEGSGAWNCAAVKKVGVSASVRYVSWNCTGAGGTWPDDWKAGPTLIHVVYANLSTATVSPIVDDKLATLSDMINNTGALAAVNGGFFWEINRKSFLDNVCFTKSRADALAPVSDSNPNHGVGDTLVRINGTLHSTNCDLIGFSHPVALVINGTSSYMQMLKRGEQLGPQYANVIANSPNLVSWRDGKPQYGIPIDDWGLNRWEHSSNAMLGLLGVPGHMHTLAIVVTDGYDGCPRQDPSCGMEAQPAAYFMLEFIGAAQAFQLDQGGSATLFVDGLGVVNSNRGKERQIFSALYVK